MKTISRNEFINLISEKPGAMIITFTARTRVGGKKGLNKKHRETKEPNPFGIVWKTAKVQAMVNCSYANAYEKATGEKWVPSDKGVWHQAALDVNERLTPFAEDKDAPGKYYLRVMFPKTLESSLESEVLGKVEWEQLTPYLPPPPAEKPVVSFLTYSLDAIQSVSFGGETYSVLPEAEPALV